MFPFKPSFVVSVLSLLPLPYYSSLASFDYKSFNKNLLNKTLYQNTRINLDVLIVFVVWENGRPEIYLDQSNRHNRKGTERPVS